MGRDWRNLFLLSGAARRGVSGAPGRPLSFEKQGVVGAPPACIDPRRRGCTGTRAGLRSVREQMVVMVRECPWAHKAVSPALGGGSHLSPLGTRMPQLWQGGVSPAGAAPARGESRGRSDGFGWLRGSSPLPSARARATFGRVPSSLPACWTWSWSGEWAGML